MKKVILLSVFTAPLLLSQANAATCLATIQQRGLTVGTSPDYPPYESLDQNNKIVGYDIDVINAIGKKMGVKVNVVGQNFDGLVPALISKKIDLIAAGMTVTPERKKTVNFTAPYDRSENVILTRKENVKLNKPALLSGKSIGVQLGTLQEQLAQGVKGGNVKSFNLFTDAAVALQTRQIDSMILDRVVAQQFTKTYPDLRIAGTLAKSQKAFAVRKDCSDVVARMNTVLGQLEKSGELNTIRKKWFK